MGTCASSFADEPDEGLLSCFEPVREIGAGGEGSVWLCHHKQSGQDVAIKLVPRGAVNWPSGQLETEVILQCRVGHVNIATAKQVLLTSKHFGIVTEYIEGGNLRQFAKHNNMTEPVACFLFRQILNALKHLHCQGIAHRDIKLSNVLLDNTSQPLPIVKLTDFGCAKQWNVERPGSMHSFTGTPGYMSPEVLDVGTGSFHAYDAREVDVWALGVSLVEMLSGSHLPFCVTRAAELPEDARHVYQQYLEHNVPWWHVNKHVSKAYQDFSTALRDLLNGMLQPDPAHRLTLEQVEQHSWTQQSLPKDFKHVLKWLDEQQTSRKEKASEVYVDVDISKQAQRVLHDMVMVSQLNTPLPHGEALWLFDPRAASGRVFTRFLGSRTRTGKPGLAPAKVQAHSTQLYNRLLADALDYTSTDSSEYVAAAEQLKV